MSAFQGKSVLVLGGSRAIGAATVNRFARDGAKVTFTCSGSEVAAKQLAAKTGAQAVQTDSADLDAVIARVKDSGPLDILGVNAGIGIFGDALEQDPDAIDRLFKINIHAPYHVSVEAAEYGRPVAVAATDRLIRERAAGLERSDAVELSRLCAARPDINRAMLRLWRAFIFPELTAAHGFRWAISSQDKALHRGNLYRFDGWVALAHSASGTDSRSGRRGRRKIVWGWCDDEDERPARTRLADT